MNIVPLSHLNPEFSTRAGLIVRICHMPLNILLSVEGGPFPTEECYLCIFPAGKQNPLQHSVVFLIQRHGTHVTLHDTLYVIRVTSCTIPNYDLAGRQQGRYSHRKSNTRRTFSSTQRHPTSTWIRYCTRAGVSCQAVIANSFIVLTSDSHARNGYTRLQRLAQCYDPATTQARRRDKLSLSALLETDNENECLGEESSSAKILWNLSHGTSPTPAASPSSRPASYSPRAGLPGVSLIPRRRHTNAGRNINSRQADRSPTALL